MSRKSVEALVQQMRAEDRDFSLEEIYRAVCRPPHQEMLTAEQLHRRISRYVGEARRQLKATGHVLILGQLRHSYRASKRKPLGK